MSRISKFLRTVQSRNYSWPHTSGVCQLPPHRAHAWLENTAMEDVYGEHTYGSLLVQSHKLAETMRKTVGESIKGERIAYLTPNDSSNLITMWAIWLNQGIAVPLCASHPLTEKQYFIDDSQAKLVVGTASYGDEIVKLCSQSSTANLIIPDRSVENLDSSELLAEQHGKGVERSTKGLIIYTSGTTGRPKGVVLTHGNIEATSNDMIEYWQWKASDVCLHVLPLHHIHGLINAVHVPLSVGAKCLMLPKFGAPEVWNHLMVPESNVSVLTAVPTVYAKLLEYYESGADPQLTPEAIKLACSRVRLMISGSSALPLPVRDRWLSLTEHILLERYGMSEILMALTNPLKAARVPGTVGFPFKSVRTMIARNDPTAPHGYVDVTNQKSDINPDQSEEGELFVKGPTVFSEYWSKPEATKEAFTPDGWFKTGDTVCIDSEGYYKVLGRTSVDIIKSGGYKISALDIESKLLLHESVSECAVIGVPHTVYGQQITALVVVKIGCTLTIEDLTAWCIDRIPKYAIPREVKILGSIPKNAMGKVNKKSLLKQYFPDAS